MRKICVNNNVFFKKSRTRILVQWRIGIRCASAQTTKSATSSGSMTIQWIKMMRIESYVKNTNITAQSAWDISTTFWSRTVARTTFADSVSAGKQRRQKETKNIAYNVATAIRTRSGWWMLMLMMTRRLSTTPIRPSNVYKDQSSKINKMRKI